MEKIYSILFIEDNQDDLELILHWIKMGGIKFDHQHVFSQNGLIEVLKNHRFDIVISDFKMPSFTGFDALKIIREFDVDLPFILVSGSIGEELAVDAMRLGCKDYIMKENLRRLVPSIERELVDAGNRKLLRKAENKIKKEEKILESIYASLPSGVGMIKERKILWMNNRLCELTGYNKKDFKDQTTRFLYKSNSDFNSVGADLYKNIERDGIGTIRTQWVCKDKSVIEVIITTTAVEKNDPDTSFIFSITDITDYKKVEDKLEKTETKFIDMQENLPIGIYRTNRKGRLLYANKELRKNLLIADNYLEQRISITDFYKNLDDRKRFMSELIINQKVSNYEVIFKRLDGKEINISINGTLVYSDDDELIIDGTIRDISDQKNAQMNLQESESKHRTMMESIPDGVYITSFNFIIEYLNPAMKKIIGHDATGESCYKAIYNREKKSDWCAFEEVKVGKMVRKDILHQVNDRIYSTIHSPLVKNNGQTSKMTIYTDVTEKRYAQKEMEVQREYFEGLFQNSPDAIVILDEEDKVIRVNESFSKLFEYAKDEVVGVEVNSLLVPDLLKTEGAKATQDVASGHYVDIETIRKTKNNKEIHVSVKGKPVILPDGKKVVYAIYRNITDQINSNKQIKLNESRLEGLLELSEYKMESEQEVLDYTLDGAIKLTDSVFGYIYHYNEEEKLFTLNSWSKDVILGLHMEQPEKEHQLDRSGLWGEVIRKREPIIVNDFLKINPEKKGYPEGHIDVERYLVIPVFSENEIVAVVGVANKQSDYDESDVRQLRLLMDSVWKIIERKRFVEELNLSKIKAEESDRLKSAFLANISHEIRTPMNAILGFSQLLSMPDISDDEKEDFISLINSRGNDLMRIIDDIIEVSNIEAGQVSIENKAIYLQDFLEKIVHSFENSKELKEKEEVSFSLLPTKKIKKEIQIFTDEEKLRMILFNLIENGLKFTLKGNVELGYKFNKTDSGMIEFYIKDSGIGIPQKKQKQIFDIFRQVDEDHTREFGGTGLGLAIAKRFVESMGGEIWVDSILGKGSTFYFTIPHYIKDDDVLKLVTQQDDQQGNKWSDKCILVVEDNPMNFMFIDRVLARMGVKTYRASDGKEAVELYCMTKDIDLVLMDINLPKKSGFEATAEMKNFNDKIPFIAQTAYSMPVDENMDFGPTFEAIIKKPYTPDQLTEIIGSFLGA
ncbi:MAG: PAS domain S-box protein [Bacteroidetes bacterium]|nr:PAS domain S-box protein [Bacteroidota bacterium]